MLKTRRQLLSAAGLLGASLPLSRYMPAWALGASQGNLGLAQMTGNIFNLRIGKFPVLIDGKRGEAIGVNGVLPAPLLRFREGDDITVNVTNSLAEGTSIHWHGLLVPFYMDGVPGVSFPGIAPGETFTYKFSVPQNGTYWYHSHSGLQEQVGHYGPLIIDPKGADPVQYDREYVLILSDWSFEDPYRLYARLKKNSEVYNFQERTVFDVLKSSQNTAMWGEMRMSPTDIADVTGAVYTYLINGHSTLDNWNAIFNPEERIRLRIINASAMTIFNFRIPNLPMTVVASDGLHVQPVETDEFQIGTAETYDVIVTPQAGQTYAMVAESIDRSGQVVATLSEKAGTRAVVPELRERPILTMRDMGHGSHGSSHHGHMMQRHDHDRGVGVDMVAAAPVFRLNEPGLGLENVPHRALTYTELKSLEPNPDQRPPEREIEIHLTGNMERYMWSFDGVKFSEVKEPIIFYEGERVRVTLVNDTMMSHPIHLHGMYFDLVTEESAYKPRKHTVIVKPAEKLSFDVTADHIGDWAFHCHLVMHMHAGMMHVVSVREGKGERKPQEMHKPMDHGEHH